MTVLLAAVASGVPAAAARVQPALTVSPATAAQGETVTISGSVPVAGSESCAPGDARITSLATLFPPDGFGPLAPRDADGNFEITYTIPTDTPAGTYQIGVRCGGGNVGISVTLAVTQPATAGTPTTEARPTTAPSTTTPSTAAESDDATGGATTGTDGDTDDGIPWIAVGALVVLAGTGAAVYLVRRRASPMPRGSEASPRSRRPL